VQFRRAIEADLEREFGVWSAAQIELHNRRGEAWPTLPYDPTGRWATIQRHLVTHDGEHLSWPKIGPGSLDSRPRWSATAAGSCLHSSSVPGIKVEPSDATCSS
jgi:hypothetical protein